MWDHLTGKDRPWDRPYGARARPHKEAQECVDKDNEQERGEGKSLSSASIHKDVRRLVLPDTNSHRSQIIKALEKVNIWNPELVQDGL